MQRPDYLGGSIVNLMASLRQAFGAPPDDVPPLRLLPPDELAGRHVMLLVLDGLGYGRCRELAGTTLQRHLRGPIHSVFPTTTVSAMTSFYTGVAPARHGMTGWFTWFRELGSVAAVLPFAPRAGGASYTEQGVEPAHLFVAPSLFTTVPGTVINPAHIADSPYSRACGGPALRRTYTTVEGLFAALEQSLAGPPRLTVAYWPEYDGLCHHQGVGSAAAEALLREFDEQLTRFLERIAGRDATLLITADHGMIDTAPERIVRLEDHPALRTDLSLPLCGEPRTAWCYVHARRREHFLDYVAEHLSHACRVVPSEQLVDEGWLGPPPHHGELAHRVGDFALMMDANHVISERLPGERPFALVGVHGGASPAEMEIPLVIIRV